MAEAAGAATPMCSRVTPGSRLMKNTAGTRTRKVKGPQAPFLWKVADKNGGISMDKRPNILWLCTDQQRWDTIHALGNSFIDTPNLDRLCR